MADAKYWNGSSWVSVPSIKHWDGAQWADVKRVLQWDGASWGEVWSAASPPESPLYLYENGTEHVSWVQGPSNSPYTYTEGSSYIYIKAEKVFYNNGGYVYAQTENPVDVTDYNTAYFYYDVGYDGGTGGTYARFYVGSGYVNVLGSGTYLTDSIDISSLTGDQYIRGYVYRSNYANDDSYTWIKIRKVWLEV